MNMIKLLAFPQRTEECICHVCNCTYSDTVEHYIMKCQGILKTRTKFWNDILDSVDCMKEVKLISKDEDEQLDICLSAPSDIFDVFSGGDHQRFLCSVSEGLQHLMYVL